MDDAQGLDLAYGDLGHRLGRIREKISLAGGDPQKLRIVAVTKGHGPEAVGAARAAGLVDIGENYAAELVSKAKFISRPSLQDLPRLQGSPRLQGLPRWHFLGAIQTNKIKALAGLVSLWHGVDRISEGIEIARHAPGASVLVQVNFTGQSGRNGVSPQETPGFVDSLSRLELEVAGLMTMAPPGSPEGARHSFGGLSDLAGRLGLDELSMGMTEDFEEAVRQGATIIRVGQGLFGPRPPIPVSRRG